MQRKKSISPQGSIAGQCQPSTAAITSLATVIDSVHADTQFSEKTAAHIHRCDSSAISGLASLKENDTDESGKEIDMYMQLNGLSEGKHAVHIHQTANCSPCGGEKTYASPQFVVDKDSVRFASGSENQ